MPLPRASLGGAAVKCITLDLTGTVFALGEPVAKTYMDAVAWGVRRPTGGVATPHPAPSQEAVHAAFKAAYKATGRAHPCFGHAAGLSSREWWRHTVRATLAGAGAEFRDEAAFEAVFLRIYQHYGTQEGYSLFPDVLPFARWAGERGIRLGVISNNNSRAIECTLPLLGASRCFDFFVVSGEVGVEKPDAGIFRHAAEVGGVATEHCVHIGDSRTLDYEGARNAGVRALLLERQDAAASGEEGEDGVVVADLHRARAIIEAASV